jgi:predicted acetyltransferase
MYSFNRRLGAGRLMCSTSIKEISARGDSLVSLGPFDKSKYRDCWNSRLENLTPKGDGACL